MEEKRCLENLRIWQWAMTFTVHIYNMMEQNRDYGFKDQIQRASVSIANNIAEGFESGSDAQFARFLNIAKGSCSEVKSMLYLAEMLNYCNREQRDELHKELKNITSGIYKLIDKLAEA